MPNLAGTAPKVQFLGFAAVGAIGFAVDAGVLQVMISLAGTGPYAGRAASFALAVSATWLLNRRWVFAASGRNRRDEYSRYFGVQVVGALINLGVYALLIEFFAVMAAYPVLALAVGAAVALVFNFSASRGLVFAAAPASLWEDERPGPDIGGSENLEVMAEAENYNRYLLHLIEDAAGDAPRMLDFGAGQGTFAYPLVRRGRDVVSVEPDRRLHTRFSAAGLDVHAEITDLPAESLPFAYSLNVLEHIDDDVAAMKLIRERLQPGGRFLIYVPAFQILFSAMDRKVGHVRRYRRGQLIRRVKRAGFDVERARYVDSLGFFAALAYRIAGNDSGDINRGALRTYDRFAFPLSLGLDIAASRFFGKNLLLIARRPELRD